MKKMTCKQLGGSCDEEFAGETMEELKQKHLDHTQQLAEEGDLGHIDVLDAMQMMENSPEALNAFYDSHEDEYDNRFDELDTDQLVEGDSESE